MASTVWYAASSFLSICVIWSLGFVFSFIISPRYLYVPVRSSSICPSVNLGFSLVFPIIIVWLFSFSEFDVVLFGNFVGDVE